jgi:hypothetical protein
MPTTDHFLTYEEKPVRLYVLESGEPAVVAADIPTGRTPAFTYQVLAKKAEFAPHVHPYAIPNPSKHGTRPGQVLTAEGVRLLVAYLRNSNSRKNKHYPEVYEKAIGWVEAELLPSMEAFTTTVGRPVHLRVGRPKPALVGGIAIQIGKIAFKGSFQDMAVDTVRVTCNGQSKVWTAQELFQALGVIPN